MRRRSWLGLLVALILPGACALEPAVRTGPVATAPLTPALPPTGRTRVTLLAPLTGPNADRGQALARAAQLALAQPGSPTLDVRDTAGTPAGAAAAAQAAVADGTGLILGPLTAGETAAVAAPARTAGIPVLAFTSDPAQAQPGVWVLGITPVQQVRRLVGAVTAQGKTRLAAILPQTDFGTALSTALINATTQAGLPAPAIQTYEGGVPSINAAVRDASGYADRRGPVDAQIKAARSLRNAEGRQRAAALSRQDIAPPPFDALLLAETGDRLATLSSLLPYYDLTPPTVRVLGPALWAVPSSHAGASLRGAWYAAPDPTTRATFDATYAAKYGGPAPGIADLAFDAASIARSLAPLGGYPIAALTTPEGFAGTDGLLVLQPDGTVRRGLAVFEIGPSGATMVEPAPASLAAPGV